MRKKPPGKLLPSAHQVDREFRVMKALEQSDVPVPRMNLLCEDETVIGTTFFVMEYVEGRLFSNVTLPGLSPGERRAIYFEMIRVLAALHSVDHEALGLSDFGKPGNYFARQIGRWSKQYVSAKTDHIASMENLMNYLPQNVPLDDTTCIVHGDYRMENMLFHPTKPRILALLDWELSTLGHPLGDLAYSCGPYHFNMPGLPGLVGACGPKTGIPTETEFVEKYCRQTGREGIPKNRLDKMFKEMDKVGVDPAVKEARAELNFSEWRTYGSGRRAEIGAKMIDLIENHEMPPPLYAIMHGETKLTGPELEVLRKWQP